MTKLEFSDGKHQIGKKTAILIVTLSVAAVAIYSISLIPLDSEELEKTVNGILFSISVLLFGIVFAIMALNQMNKYLIIAFAILIGIMAAILAMLPLLFNPNIKLALFFPIYYTGSIGWFLGINRYVIGNNDSDEKRYASSTMNIMLGYLLFISVLIYPLYFITISPLNPNSGT